MGQELFDLTLNIASGQKSIGEKAGHSQISVWRDWRQTDDSKLIQLQNTREPDGKPLSIIPTDLYEAAKVEGASRWQTFVKITIPLLMPIIFFLLLTGFINSFQAFNHIYVMQTSSAGDTMDVVTVEIFDHFWGRVKYGYAAAEGVVLFILLNVLAISQYVFFRKRLNYD